VIILTAGKKKISLASRYISGEVGGKKAERGREDGKGTSEINSLSGRETKKRRKGEKSILSYTRPLRGDERKKGELSELTKSPLSRNGGVGVYWFEGVFGEGRGSREGIWGVSWEGDLCVGALSVCGGGRSVDFGPSGGVVTISARLRVGGENGR